MKGTAKQVKWAESIKAKLVEDVRRSYDAYKDQCSIAPEKVMAYFEKAAEIFCAGHDDATWWIDNRNGSILGGIDEIVNDLYNDAGNDKPKALTADEMRKIGMPYFDETMIDEEVKHQQKIRDYYKAIVADGPNNTHYPKIPGMRSLETSSDPAYKEAVKWLAEHELRR